MEKIMFHIAIAQFFNVAFTFHQGLLNFLSVKKAGDILSAQRKPLSYILVLTIFLLAYNLFLIS